ncbi:pyruvate decarboxylase [Chryseobacterium sp. NEB161]|nr:pyruvate decarboxylase [Chryseobacterium sp. NEB161]
MKKNYPFSILLLCIIMSCANYGDSLLYYKKDAKINGVKTVLFFDPEVFPDIDEIKDPTYSAFSNAASDKMRSISIKYLQVNKAIPFEEIDTKIVQEICKNNNADVAIIPKVKYFKVGFGKYVFSNQVVVSLKLYDSEGNYIMETSYDTYKGNARLLGSAENSVIIGTKGAIRKMEKELRNRQIILRKAS